MKPEPTDCEGAGALRDKVTRGVAWNLAEKIGTGLMQMAVSLIILRLLTQEDLGLMAILTAVSVVMLVIVDSGFSQALIRRREPSQADFKSVFFFNVGVSVALYVLCVAATPAAARFYDMPELVPLAPVFFLLLPVNALCAVQNAILTRQFRFALLSKVTFVSWLVSGLAAIGLALAGCGVWSVVAQRLLQMAVRAGLLWGFSDWRPSGGACGVNPLRQMARYSFSLMSTELITTIYNKIPQFVIGRLYPTGVLGAFDQAVKLKDQPVSSTMLAVQNVIFPALAKVGNDACRFAESYRQIVMLVAYLLFPMMMGLSAVAPDLFAALLGEEWMSAVPYFEVICLVGLFYPVAMIAFTVLKVKSDGRIILRIEFLKKGLMTLVFIATIPVSVQAVAWGLVVIAFCEMAVNVVASMRFTVLTIRRLLRTLLPVAAVTAAMYGAVRLTMRCLPFGDAGRLAVEIGVGIVVYVLLSVAFRLEAFRETVALVKRQIGQSSSSTM